MSLCLLSEISLALPALTNKCGPKGINFVAPLNTEIVGFDEECQTAYIGPPAVGRIDVDQGLGSTNLLFCETVKMLPKVIEASRAGIKVWAEKLVKKSNEYDAISEQVSAYKKTLVDLEPSLAAKKKRLQNKEDDLKNARNQMTEIKEKLNDCISSSESTADCEPIKGELLKIKQTVDLKRGMVSDLQAEIIDVEYEVKKTQGNIEEIDDRLTRIMGDLETYKRLLTGLENDALDGYQRYGQLFGATATVTFRSDWQALLAEAQQKNSHLKLSIQQLPLVSSTVAISSAIPEGFTVKNVGVLLGTRVPGFDSHQSQAKSTKIDLGRNLSLNPVPWTTTMTGQLDFNLIGACGMTDSANTFVLAKAKETVGAMLAVNLQHTYPMLMKRNYEITFNTIKMTSEMEKMVESGGFLSASKIHNLTHSNMNKDTFDIKFYDEGGATAYEDNEKQQITIDAKYEIFDQILKGMNAVPQFNPDKLPPPRLDRSTGARFIHDNLPCFGFSICYATGFIIGVVDALFGSTEAVTEFKEENETSITHRYSSTSPGYYMMSTTFSGKGK